MRGVTPLLVLCALAPALFGQAPAGFRTHADRDSGLTFYYPTAFQEIPVPPTESLVKAKYVRKSVPDALSRLPKHFGEPKPTFEVFLLRKAQGGTTPRVEASAQPESRPDSGAESRPDSQPDAKGPKTLREAFEERGRVEGFEAFKERKLAGWDLKPIGLPQGAVKEYGLVRKGFAPDKKSKDPWQVGFLWIRDDGPHYVGVLGFTLSPDERDSQAELRRVGRSLVLRDAGESVDASARLYTNSKLPHIPFRCQVRDALAKGWKALDTENYILVYHTANERLINKIARDLEAIRPFYVELFPPAKTIENVSIVRICRNRQEYHTYGGPPGSGGYWHPGNEELVFYDYEQTQREEEKAKGRRLTDKDSFVVLYHEAFHQYIYFAVGQIAPHDWFNEGYGDYFSGAIIPQYGTRVTKIGPSRWRITRAKWTANPDSVPKSGLNIGAWVPIERIVKAEREEYYGPAISNYYTGGWSLVYFLREAPEAQKHPKWSKILGTYFETLKNDYNAHPAVASGEASLEQKHKAGVSAREAAYKAAFSDVDLADLDAAVKSFITRTKHPWPEDLSP